MGCDIHGVIQVQRKSGWETVEQGFGDRNYHAFAILANVRNGYGFVGTPTAQPFNYISEPRGLPDDFEMEDDEHPLPESFVWEEEDWHAKENKRAIWMGDHSFSWLSACELLGFDWDQVTTLYGVISASETDEWVKYSAKYNWAPKSYSADSWGPGLSQTITQEEYVAGLRPDVQTLNVRVHWEETYAKAVGENFLAFVLRMVRFDGPTRFVFGFDS